MTRPCPTSSPSTGRASAPLVQEKIARLAESPDFSGFFFRRIEAPPDGLAGNGALLAQAREVLAGVEPFAAGPIEEGLRDLAEGLAT